MPADQTSLSFELIDATDAPTPKRGRGAGRPKKEAPPPSIPSIVQSARKIMRKDKGLNGELDRLPALTWILMLKFLDDRERTWEEEAVLQGTPYRPVIEAPYRWRDWAEDPAGITGDQLIAFIGQDEAVRPDGSRGAGLLAYLRSLASGTERQRVVGSVFEDVSNRMKSGYLLRDVITLVDGIHFSQTKELQALGLVYESMLREMRDAAGDSGEFYTPRPVVRFMVERTNPRLGETVLDPASGTGGFLAAAYEHLHALARNAEDFATLETGSVMGNEAKSLPYMLGQMNLLLHGVEAPHLTLGNSLDIQLSELSDADRVDVILSNPPFGGEEEARISNGFPKDRQTRETALLFLQLIMRRLRRPSALHRPGRAAVVVPNGTLFATGVGSRIKEDLLTGFRLHTVVRLPEGTFAPYTDIPANLLFFDRSGPTDTVWFYEIERPEGRKKYTKTKPMRDDDFAACAAWWDDRTETPQAWAYDFKATWDAATAAAGPLKAEAEDLDAQAAKATGAERDALRQKATDARQRADAFLDAALNLDLKNPNTPDTEDHRSPADIAHALVEREGQILALLHELNALVGEAAHG